MYCPVGGSHVSAFLLCLSPGKVKAAKAASTVLCNMFQYTKLHKDYKKVRLILQFQRLFFFFFFLSNTKGLWKMQVHRTDDPLRDIDWCIAGHGHISVA